MVGQACLVVGEGSTGPVAQTRTGTGAQTSAGAERKLSGIPRLMAFWRIWVPGDGHPKTWWTPWPATTCVWIFVGCTCTALAEKPGLVRSVGLMILMPGE